jgi:glycoside hydrolase-like protein
MRQKNHMMGRYVVLLTAFVALMTAPVPAFAHARSDEPLPGLPVPTVEPAPARMPDLGRPGLWQPDLGQPGLAAPGDTAPDTASTLGRVDAAPAGDTSGDPRADGAKIYHGYGFDTCIAPSYATMRAWSSSPFRALGVYVGGRARACPHQPNLTTSWVRDVTDLGWKLLPLYVGSQSPCVTSDRKQQYALDEDGGARAQGAAEGRDAVASAQRLGMSEHSAVYLDMEPYDESDSACARTTLRFVQGWSHAVRALGYLPGFYSNAGSGITHMESSREAGAADLPGAVWFARWHTGPSVSDEPSLASGAWQPHRRIHQYAGDVTETYGGVRLQIDKDLVDAPVAVVD